MGNAASTNISVPESVLDQAHREYREVTTQAPEGESSRRPRYRLVDRYLVHGGERPFAERIGEVLPPDVDYVVLDLDKTVHLGIAIGEQFGWEMIAATDLDDAESAGDPPPIVAWTRPLASGACVLRGIRTWSVPGLVYAATVRLGDRWERWGEYLCVSLGPNYVERMQTFVRSILMSHLAGRTRSQLELYAERAWRRWQHRLVVDRAAIDEIRARCPRLKGILLSSASPTPTVEHAARTLGVDGYIASGLDLRQEDDAEVYAAPVELAPWFRGSRPKFYSRPGAVTHNAAENKVRFMRMQFPEVFDEGSVTG